MKEEKSSFYTAQFYLYRQKKLDTVKYSIGDYS